MRTSRIAKETAKTVNRVLQNDTIGRRQTRSFATSLLAFSADADPPQKTEDSTVKQEDFTDDGSDLSSLASSMVLDIEDLPKQVSPSRKRKRELDTPSTTLTSISTHTTTRSSPRKADIKVEDDRVRKARRQPAQKLYNEAGKVEIHAPENWEEIYDSVKEMRKRLLAPVDTMGCETLAEEHVSPRVSLVPYWLPSAPSNRSQHKRFQTLIALMLSSQTKDTTNAIAMRRLQTELPVPGLTLENILDVDPVRLNEMIYVVGFHNNKTRYIKATAVILRDSFASDIPDTIEGLISLPGVGPKMAYLCLSAAWGRTEGIGVDVHVHRITNLWGWHKTKQPEETRAALEAWLPREKWHEINHLLVGFGQTICLPVGRRCEECTLSVKGLCPSAVVGRKRVTKRAKKEHVVTGKKVAHLQGLETQTIHEVKEEKSI
ncbi:DNA N-glycosylase and apurinic/apyrimidinic (AP) lyase [Sticta canariensis]|nr:DNA N-glycosylase and apurinic/apyrimidinic (AP) lyase [Sticta canariensis]